MLSVEQLYVNYGEKEILHDVDLQVDQEEIVMIVGESGSGKSTLVRSIMGLLGEEGHITKGNIVFQGVNLCQLNKKQYRELRGSRIAMVFQQPESSFDPTQTIHRQFYEAMNVHRKVNVQEAKQTAKSLLGMLGFREPETILSKYPFELSGGMNQRVAIALAMILNPQLLLADEPTSALDVTVQAQCVKEMMDLRQHLGTTIIIVTHNMGVVSHMADKVAVMYAGSIVEYGSKADVLNHPKHPYTKALIASIPQIGGTIPKGIPGQPPAFGEVFTGCSFSPRCSLCDNICTHEKPVMHSGENGHAVFCHKCLSEV